MPIFLYRFIRGILHLRLITEAPERFLNLCFANNIEIYKSSYKGGKLYFKTDIKSFKKIRRINSRFHGKVHILHKVGLPFIIYKNKKRYGFLIGVIVFFAFLGVMSQFVWSVQIVGATPENAEKAKVALKEIGICEGKKISQIDTKVMRNELLLKAKEFSWAAINIEGVLVTVDVTETEKRDEVLDYPTNIKAEFDGVIKAVEVIKGTPLASVGQAVRKGDLLISGTVEYLDLHTELVRSRGRIIAEIEHEITTKTPLKLKENVKTGREERKTVLEFFGLKIPLYLGSVKGDFECTKTERNLKIWGKTLPIKTVTKNFYFTEERENYFSVSDASVLAQKTLDEKITKFLGDGKILDIKITEKVEGDSLVLTAKIRCEKNIGLEEKILVSTRN